MRTCRPDKSKREGEGTEGVGSIHLGSKGVRSDLGEVCTVCCVLKSRRIGWSRRGTEKGKRQHDEIDETRSGLDWTRTRGRQYYKAKLGGNETGRGGRLKMDERVGEGERELGGVGEQI
jgi:hypothetical protein